MARSKATPKGKTAATTGAKSKSNTSSSKTTKKTATAKTARPVAKSTSNATSTSRAKRKPASDSLSLSHDLIAARAYEIWESSGYPSGCEVEHWIQAEQDLLRSGRP